METRKKSDKRAIGKRMFNILTVTSMILATLSIIIFISEPVSAGPIINISVTGQASGTAIENGDPGTDVLFDVKISNNGDATATVNLSVAGTPNGWSATLTGTNFTLGAGSSQNEVLTVSIYSQALETDFASLTIRDTTNNRQDTCRVNVDQVYGLTFETADTIKSTLPDNTVSFTLPINNTGNGIDTTSFTDSGAPQQWTVSYDTSKNLAAFKVTNVGVNVYVPADTLAKTYSLSVTGTSEDGGTFATKTLTLTVKSEYGVMITTLPSASLLASPGGRTSYTMKITNLGNARDRFGVKVADKTSGWTATLATSKTPQLSAGASYNVTLQVTPPIDAVDTDLGYVNVTVTSQHNASQNETAYTITRISQERYLSLSVDNSSVTGAQKETVSFTFEVTNSGNTQDRIDISATPPAGWSSPNISPTYFTLSSGKSSEFTVKQAIPSDALHQGYSLAVKAQSRDDKNASTTSTVTVDVEQKYGVQVTIPGTNTKDASPGDTLTYSFAVRNKGNGEDTITLSQSGIPIGWSWVFSDSSVTLGAEKEDKVNLTVTVPADYENFGSLEVELVAISSGNASARDNSSSIIINVQKSYSIVLSCNTTHKNGYPEDNVNYIITITNDGNAEDLVVVAVDKGPQSFWASLNKSRFTISPNSYKEVNLTVAIPTNQPADKYYINITATSKRAKDQGGKVTDTLSTMTTVKPLFEVYLFPDGGNIKKGAVGESVEFRLGVQNRGLDEDTFDMSFTGDYPFTNWVSMAYQNYTIVDLAKNAIQRISFAVDIPANAHELYPGLTSGTVNITATSRGDPTKTYAIGFETVVEAEFGATLSTGNDFDSAMPGANATFEVTLKNTGSSSTDIFGIDDKDSEFENVYISPSTFEINRSEVIDITVTVTVDDDAKKGTHVFNVTAKSAGEDGVLSRGDEEVATLQLEIKVQQHYDIRATCSQNTKEVGPGEYVSYEIEVENRGNGEDIFDIAKYSSNVTHLGWAVLDINSVTLDREEITTVKLNVSVPSNTEPISINIYVNITSRENATNKISIRTISTVTQKFAMRLTSNDLNKEVDPGSTIQFNIDIKNEGTGNDEIEISVVSEGEAGAQASWVEIPLQELVFTLSPNEIKRVVIDVTPPDDTEVDNYPITIKAESLRSVEDVEDDITATVIVNPKRDLSLEVTTDRKEVLPHLSGDEAEVTFDLKVINKGTASDDFKLEVMRAFSDHHSWVRLSTKNINSLAADGDKTVTVTVEIPNKEDPTSSDGFNTGIYVYSPGGQGIRDDIGQTINITTVIKAVYGLELSTNDKRKETPSLTSTFARHRTVTFPFSVENLGTGNDSVKFEVVDKPSDWNDVSIDLSTEEIGVGAKANAVLTANMDPEVAVGNYDIKVQVISRGDDTRYEENEDVIEEITFTVKVTTINEVKLTTTQSLKEAKPGETVTYKITVKNLGNAKDTITLKLPNELLKWGTRTISPTSMELEAKGEGSDSTMDVTATFRISSDYFKALKGSYSTMITATAGEGSDEFETTLNITTSITQEFALELTGKDFDKSDGIADPINPVEKTVKYSLTVENKGNGKDSFELELTGEDAGWAVFESTGTQSMKTSELDPGGESSITVEVTIGTDFDEWKADKYDDIVITVTSSGDDSVETTATLTLTIEEVYNLQLSPWGASNEVDLNPVDEATLTYKIDVENGGNKADTVKFTIKDSPDDWTLDFDKSTLNVPLGKTETISLDVTPDAEVEEGTYTIFVRAKSTDGTYTLFVLTVNIKLPVLQIDSVEFEEGVLEGESTMITVKVTNTGKAEAKDVRLTFSDKRAIGSEDVNSIKPGETKTVDFADWPTDRITAGKHTIKVSLTNEPSGEVSEKEGMVKIKGEGAPWYEQKGAQWTLIGLIAAFVVIIIIILIFARARKPLPSDIEEEIAKAKTEEKKEEEEGEEGEEEKLLESKERPALPESTEKTKEGPSKKVKIKCPKCVNIQTVASPKRPLEFECEDCGMKLLLKK